MEIRNFNLPKNEVETRLLENKATITKQELKEFFPGKQIYACDFYVEKIEKDAKVLGGFSDGVITNLDHHAPVKEMAKMISSTNLAIEYVLKNGPVRNNNDVIAINHTDCDSVLSSAILKGVIKPEEKFGQAAIAADHTGQENTIADLLQAVQQKRDLNFSLRNLTLMIEGKPLEGEAESLLQKRREDRERVKKLVESGMFQNREGIYYTSSDERIDGEILPGQLPEAKLIVFASPLANKPGFWDIKVRVGLAGRNINLNDLSLPDFGGRWNAGSTKRHGGTELSLQEYVDIIFDKLSK